MGSVRVVNMIPASLSGETSQDSEPNLAVNPERPTDMVATAFTPAPMGGSFAPIYVSTDGGVTWALRNVVPGNGPYGTGDITVGFATTGGTLYAGILNGQATGRRMQILRTAAFASTTAMDVLVDRTGPDQPWVVAGSVVVGGRSRDRVFVGNNDLNGTGLPGATAAVDVSQDAAASSPTFLESGLENRSTSGQDGPPVRLALHPDGTVYAAFHRWTQRTGPVTQPNVTFDVVVKRDDHWAGDVDTFFDLVDRDDGVEGQRVRTGAFVHWNESMGQERLGGDLSIAVDPNDSSTVWIAWCERVGGPAGSDWTLRVTRSTDRGQNWAPVLREITNAKNPALAVNGWNGLLGLAYQEFTGIQWVTRLELTGDAWASAAETHVLHQASWSTPGVQFFPYLGDYIRLLALDDGSFCGVFSGSNAPFAENFPSGVTYQRSADWGLLQLLGTDGETLVPTSIDPFFFQWQESTAPGVFPPAPSPPHVQVTPGPITRSIEPITINRTPIFRQPIISPGPTRRAAEPEPPTDLDL